MTNSVRRTCSLICVLVIWHGQVNANIWNCLKAGHVFEAMTYTKAKASKAAVDMYSNLKAAISASRTEIWKKTGGRDAYSELLYEQLTSPGFKPSAEQIRLIESSPAKKVFFQTALRTRQGITGSLKLLKGLSLGLTWRPWVFHAKGEGNGRVRSTTLAIRSALVPIARFFLPFGEFLPAKWEGPTSPIFEKMAYNENYTPSKQEVRDLKKYGVYEKFVELQRFRTSSKGARGYHQVKKVVRMAIILMLAVGALMALNLNQVVQVDGMITIQEHFSKYRLKPHQVAFIQETVPFPHMAVQVGDMIFSPGQTTISVSTPAEYMRSQEVYRIAEKNGWIQKASGEGQGKKELVYDGWADWAKQKIREPIDGSIASVKSRVGQVMSKLYTATGWNKQPRSMYVTTLNVGIENAKKIKNYWLDQVGKRYENNTMVWDCASESLYAIDPENKVYFKRLFDASPGGVTQVFAAMKVIGNSPYEVDSVRLVMAEDADRANYHLGRNGYLSMLENKLFAHMLLINQAQRSWTEFMNDPEDRRWHTEHFDKWIDEQAAEARKLLVSKDLSDAYLDDGAENLLDYYRETSEYVGQTSGPELKRKFLTKRVLPFYEEQIRFHESKMQSINLFPAERINHAIRRDYFTDLRQSILSQ